MNILLDECVPWPMHRLLAAHQCTTAQHCGWGGKKNGELLRLAESRFDLFVTSDQNIHTNRISLGFESRFSNFRPTICVGSKLPRL
jgi:hypothetical protein